MLKLTTTLAATATAAATLLLLAATTTTMTTTAQQPQAQWAAPQTYSLITNTSLAAANVEISAAGASFPANFYYACAFAFSSVFPVKLSYASMGSGKGKCRLTQSCPPTDVAPPRAVDLAGTDSIFSSSDYDTFPDLQLYPAIAGAVVIVFNVPGLTNLNLPPDVVADMFRQCDPTKTCPPGWISRWDDPRILAANPTVDASVLTAAGQITVVVRSDNSGTTQITKTGLMQYSAAFATQLAGNLNDNAVWTNATVVKANTNAGVTGLVLATLNSVGYTSLDEAQRAGLPHAGMGPSVLETDGVLRATPRSVSYALMEKGMAFGNNGDAPQHLTATVSGAKGSEAWPLTGFSYFAVRKQTLRAGTTCSENRKAVMQFLVWYYSSTTVPDIAESLGFVSLPTDAKSFVLGKIKAQFACNDAAATLIYPNSAVADAVFALPTTARALFVPVTVVTAPEVRAALTLYADTYGVGKARVASVTVTSSSPTPTPSSRFTTMSIQSESALRATPSTATTTTTTPTNNNNQFIVPFAAASWGAVYNLCDNRLPTAASCQTNSIDLVLDTPTLVDILTGVITTWNHARLVQLQPTSASQATLANVSAPILVMAFAPTSPAKTQLQAIVASRLGVPTSSPIISSLGTGVNAQPQYDDADEAFHGVAGTQFSLAVGVVAHSFDQSVFRVARMLDVTGNVTLASGASLEACVSAPSSPTTPNANANAPAATTTPTSSTTWLALSTSPNAGCWPLAEAYYLIAPAGGYPTSACQARWPQETILFADFIFSETFGEGPLNALGMSHITLSASRSKISTMTCYGRSITNPTVDAQLIPPGLAYGSIALAVLLQVVFVMVAVWVWTHRRSGPVRASSPVFSLLMIMGFLLELATVVPLTLQDGGDLTLAAGSTWSQSQLDTACMAAPWLFAVGFLCVYGSLLVKTWRVFRIFNNPLLKTVHITNVQLLRKWALATTPVVGLLVAWTVTDPLRWRRVVTSTDATTGEILQTSGQCVSNNGLVFVVPIVCVLLSFVVAGLVLAWKNRSTPTDYSEGRYVTAAIVADFELGVIGIPILVLASSNPLESFVVKVAFIFLSVVGTGAIFFIPKIAVVMGMWESDSGISSLVNRGGGGKGDDQDAARRMHDGSSNKNSNRISGLPMKDVSNRTRGFSFTAQFPQGSPRASPRASPSGSLDASHDLKVYGSAASMMTKMWGSGSFEPSPRARGPSPARDGEHVHAAGSSGNLSSGNVPGGGGGGQGHGGVRTNSSGNLVGGKPASSVAVMVGPAGL